MLCLHFKKETVIVRLVNYAFASLIFANLPCEGNQEGHRCVLILNQEQTQSS